MKTIWTQKIRFGRIDDELFYLLPPSFDCGWYWSFGYLESKRSFTHLNRLNDDTGSSIYDALINIDKLNPKIKQNIWLFLELSFTAYELKRAAEILGRGSSNYASNPPLVNLVKNTTEVDRINQLVLPEVFNTLYNLIK